MANLTNSSLIPNVTEIYFSSNGTVLETNGTGIFHAQNNYSNIISVYIEDGNGDNTTTLINFSPKKYQATVKPLYTSHWFFMHYVGEEQKTIASETRAFSHFVIKVPNTVLRYNNLSLTQNTVTVIQRYGTNYVGTYQTQGDLANALTDETNYSADATVADLDALLDATPTVGEIYEVTDNTFTIASGNTFSTITAMLADATHTTGDILYISTLKAYYKYDGGGTADIDNYTLFQSPLSFATSAYKYLGTSAADFNNWEYYLTPDNLADGLYTAYVIADAGFFQVVDVEGTLEWAEVTTIQAALQTKQYNTFDISVQSGLSSDLDVTPITVSASAVIMQSVADIEQQYVESNQALVAHLDDTANPHRTTITNLEDTAITSVANGNIVRYSSVSEKWENSATLTTAETNITNLQGRMTTAEGDIDDLETTQAAIIAGTQDITYDNTVSELTATTVKDALDEIDDNVDSAQAQLDAHEADLNNPHEVTKAQVGLGNADNTSDLNKPISTATQNALNLKVDKNATIVSGVSATDYIYAQQGGTEKRISVTNLKASIIENLVAFGYVVFTEKDGSGQPVITSPQTNKIYLYNPTNDDTPNDQYEEWIYVEADDAFEQIGTTAIALQDYYTSAQVDTLLDNYDTSAEVDAKVDIPLRLQLYPNTKNTSGSTIGKGSVVQFDGSQGDFIKIKRANASEINANPSLLMGLARENIINNAFGDVVWFGNVLNIPTGSFTTGQILWFDTVTGGLTNVEPSDNKIQVAAVEKASNIPSSTDGILLVRIKYVTRQIDDVSGLQTALDGKVAKTGDTITGQLNVVSSATNQVPLVVNTVAGQTANLQEWKTNNSDTARVTNGGRFLTNAGISNLTNANNAGVNIETTGTTISRNIADANPALVVNQVNASSTGNIQEWRNSTGLVGRVTTAGNFNVKAIYDIDNTAYYLDPSNTSTSLTVAGNVGIGTTSPTANLSIHDSADALTYLQLTNNTTGTSLTDGLNIVQNGLNSVFINRENGYMAFETNNTEKVRITAGGNVGIGNTNPQEKLDVTGNIKASGSITSASATVNGTIVASGEITAPSIKLGSWRLIADESSATLNFEVV